MIGIEEKVMKRNNINFHLIPTKKFKTINFVLKSKAPLDRATITKRALLPSVLQKGTKNYPTEKELMTRLDELYGAKLFIDGAKKGNNHIISFRLEVANEQYVPDETSLMKDALALYKEIIFHPRVDKGRFHEETVTREKQTLEHKINSLYDDKMTYANMRLIEEMFQNERFQIHKDGYIADLPEINGQSLYEYYEQLLTSDQMDLYVVGDFVVSDMEKILDEFLSREHVVTIDEVDEAIVLPTEVKEVKETQPVQQAKLHIGYRTNCTYQDPDYYALQVFNGIFGGFPSSKLFVNVREKHSLAYYAASRIESHIGLLIVFSGIEPSDDEKTREIIELQMQAMKNGEFSDAQVEETKQLIISELKETLDHTYGIPELLYQQVIGEKDVTPDAFIKEVEQVTKADIIKVAEKITLDTVYILTNDGGERSEA